MQDILFYSTVIALIWMVYQISLVVSRRDGGEAVITVKAQEDEVQEDEGVHWTHFKRTAVRFMVLVNPGYLPIAQIDQGKLALVEMFAVEGYYLVGDDEVFIVFRQGEAAPYATVNGEEVYLTIRANTPTTNTPDIPEGY